MCVPTATTTPQPPAPIPADRVTIQASAARKQERGSLSQPHGGPTPPTLYRSPPSARQGPEEVPVSAAARAAGVLFFSNSCQKTTEQKQKKKKIQGKRSKVKCVFQSQKQRKNQQGTKKAEMLQEGRLEKTCFEATTLFFFF